MHRIASTTCVNGVKLLRKRITGGIPSNGHITPKQIIIRECEEERKFLLFKIIYLN